MKCNWIYFPSNRRPPEKLLDVVKSFDSAMSQIASPDNTLKSDQVLECVADDLENADFIVERGKKKEDLIKIPVLFKDQGQIEKSFDVDAFNQELGIVVEVEAGRAVANNQFLKDFFEACMMFDARYLCIAVRNVYKAGASKSRDYESVSTFFKTLYASNRLGVPLDGILIIGY